MLSSWHGIRLVGTTRHDLSGGPGLLLPIPLPLVTDLDGDGKAEVVMLMDGGSKLRVLSVPLASGENLVSQRKRRIRAW